MFQLKRHFTITSLFAFLLVLIGLGYFYTWTATDNLIEAAERNNITVTQLFSNTQWPDYAEFAVQAPFLEVEALRDHPETIALYEAVRNQMANTAVIKVKVYSLDGLTIFSTDETQIGEDKRDNIGVIAARNGQVNSELTHRDSFDAFEQTISDLDVIASYIPIRRSIDAPVEGVFEVYSEVTPLLNVIERTRTNVIAVVAGMLGILHLALLFVVRRADTILTRQHQTLLETQAELQTERSQLTARVTEQTADLRKANTELIHAARLKDQFLAMISHELRTPLATILGRSETLLENVYGTVTATQRNVLKGIQSSGLHLLELVNDLLDVSKVAISEISIEKSTTSLAKICEDALDNVQSKIQEKQLKINYTMDDSIGEIEVDPRRLCQILINLLSNAAKFTPEGGAIGLDVYGDRKKRTVRLIVWDEGIGIPESEHQRIFEPFMQVDNRLARNYGGAGLGLALVKHLTEEHGGTVTVQSSAAGGSRFTVALPWSVSAEIESSREKIALLPSFSPSLV